MSGDGGGIIVGGIAVLALAPVIISGAVAIGLGYGAIKAGGFLAKHARNYAREKKREKELVVANCSNELNALFSDMRSVVSQETAAYSHTAEQMSIRFEEMGKQIHELSKSSPSVEELDRAISGSQRDFSSVLQSETTKARTKMEESLKKNMNKCVTEIEKINANKESLIKWSEKNETSIALQKSTAMNVIRDAEAAFSVIDSMSTSSNDAAFKMKVKAISSTLEQGRKMMDQGMYQGAFSSAKTVIRESAMLASEHVREEMEMDMASMELKAKLERLIEELKITRFIEFEDTTKKQAKHVKVDLNRFSQGKYLGMIENLEKVEEELENVRNLYEVKRLMDRFDNELEPEARRITNCSLRILKGYYERLHALEVVTDFMTQQDYAMDWAMPVGGDLSQKLVVHFVQKLTGNSVSVTLDSDFNADNIAQMAMEILTFYGSGRPVTEAEKKQLRDHLTEELNRHGFAGQLACQGRENLPSEQTEMNDKDKVRQQIPKDIV